MTEYIERDAVLAKDVAPVRHGRWIYDYSEDYFDHYHCSECGKDILVYNGAFEESTPNYCESCGAKMDMKE